MDKPNLNKPVYSVFPGLKNRIEKNQCPNCANSIREEDFRDSLSKKEYGISGLCQECQDKLFKEEED